MIPSDPEMLYSYLNLQLRDHYSSFEEMCDRLDVSETEITEKMKSAGYIYDEKTNRFVAVRRPGGIV